MGELIGIKQLINQKKSAIQKRTQTGIHEHVNFKRLHSSCATYKNRRPVTGILSIIIKTNDIKASTYAELKTLYDSIDTCIKAACNHVKIDANYNLVEFDRIHYGDTNEVRRIYCELSRDNYCVIVISSTFTTYFIDGDEVGDAIFFTKEDQERFERRKEITELKELFEEYRQFITKRPVYQNFFVSNSGKRSLFNHLIGSEKKENKAEENKFLLTHKNLLENKPENLFRENLRNFLDNKLKGTVYITKEHILESFKRIDIFINDEYGELYLIEVKWIGLSIHASGTSFGTEFKPRDVNPDGIIQSLKYISELHKHNKDIKIGYLVVFDARYEDSEDSGIDFDSSTLDEELIKYFYRFEKIKDFRVKNIHPN